MTRFSPQPPSPQHLTINPPLTSPAHVVDLSSFSDFLRRQAPELLPTGNQRRSSGGRRRAAARDHHRGPAISGRCPDRGDRRSTQGNMIAGRDVQKVYITDDYTATGIAGTAALAVEFARLYAVELEHYEKLEGVAMTFPARSTGWRSWCAAISAPPCRDSSRCLLVGYDRDDPIRPPPDASSPSTPPAAGTSRMRATRPSAPVRCSRRPR